ncbi:hypothetical protein ACM42_26515 [Bradyrhizobium sp. CCBAU 25338]|nr:hypothetical protein [Bradyrhizobium sp. CCBAU 45389]MDA9531949.1 hypothetical protein [Bradyrhizobium sp. CCBAU 25338]RXH32265.1 hypothetical protein XH84_13695 [Bradyrhizobium nanningense]
MPRGSGIDCFPPVLLSAKQTVSPASRASLPFIEPANPDLRALQILQHTDRPIEFQLQRTDRGEHTGVIVMGPVAEVQPESISPRKIKRTKLFRRRGRWTNGYNDLSVA